SGNLATLAVAHWNPVPIKLFGVSRAPASPPRGRMASGDISPLRECPTPPAGPFISVPVVPGTSGFVYIRAPFGNLTSWDVSSVGSERMLHTHEVTGSNPVRPTPGA